MTGLTAGDYRFVETKAPKGYLLNTTPKAFTIQEDYAGKPVVEDAGELINYQGSAKLIKKDATGEVLPGAEFKVTDEAGKIVKEKIISNDQGEVVADGLAPGTYYFEEIKAPDGYLLNSQKVEFTILAESEDAPTVIEVGVFRNYQGSATMKKVNEEGEVLKGAKFKLSSPEQESFETREISSDEEGLIEMTDLAPGNYVLSEVAAPDTYMLNQQEVKFTIEDAAKAEPQVIDLGEFVNYHGSIHFKKINGHQIARATQGLAGAEFTLSKIEGYQSDQFKPTIHKANEDGEVIIKGLAPGRYVLEETQAPADFIQRLEPIVFDVAASAFSQPANAYQFNNELIFENYQGTAELTKLTDKGEILSGASFNLINTDSGEVVQTDLVSNEEGLVKAENLAPGNYAFIETMAPNGYLINQKEVPFTIAESSEDGKVDITGLELINYRGSITLNKVDATNKPLAEAEFSLFKKSLAEDQLIAEGLVTDDLGQITVTDLLATGEYYFKETQAPVGYILNSQPIEVTMIESASGKPESVVVKAVNYQGTASLLKVNEAQAPLAGAVFNVVSKDQQDNDGTDLVIQSQLKSTDDGMVNVANLAPGNYAFVEVTAAPGYLLNTVETPFTVESVQAGEPKEVLAGNFINYQGSAILIKKDAAGKALAKAEFKVVDEAGQTVKETLVSTKKGEVLVTGLAPGNYYFIETKAPKGHVVNSEKIGFTILAENEGQPSVVKVADFINYQGSAELIKTDVEGKGLAGAEFKVINSNNKVVAKNLVSSDQGIVSVTGLTTGDYHFVETKAPKGYLLNTTPKAFTIQEDYAGKPVVEDAGELINYQGSAKLIKKDATGEVLPGAEFKVVDDAGQTVKETIVSNEKGEVVADGLAPGTYYFEETKAPDGYLLNSQKVKFTILAESEGAPTVIEVGEFRNYQGSASLLKVSEDNRPLAGAVFNVVSKEHKDSDGTDLVIQSQLKSTDDGMVYVANLAPGNYAFVEVTAAPGYLLNTVEAPFTVESVQAGEPKEVLAGNFINYQGSVSLTKRDQETKQVLEGAHFKLVDQIGKTLQEELITDEEGQLVVDGLEPGTYQLIETQAPSGYQLDEKAVEFEIDAVSSGKPKLVQVEKTNQAIVPVKPEKPTKQVGHKTKKPTKQNLPQAGTEDSLLLVFAGLGLITFVLGIKRRKTA